MVAANESSIKEMIERVKVEAAEEDCTPCLEELKVGFEASQIQCSHVFHGDCMEKWVWRAVTSFLAISFLPNKVMFNSLLSLLTKIVMLGCIPHMTGQRNVKALILSVSVLVAIEIFNPLNILSQVGTLFAMPPWGKL
ncbi:hypothetical protein E1A91_D08G005500v1 [Gossypium mustelinum]|uniref:RING-type domain-containing protein n=1 Tax=Gossypium mustelinum TaxID=34275 RepID=A0A5D2TRX0_GOSMU|nr:hypothetical protein E1A91_D08G005500v1 [Gossypium mustelinum]